jgi:hypothetical protein
MKTSIRRRIFLGPSAGLALLVAWVVLHHPQGHSLFDRLSGGAKRILQWPLFSLGDVPVTALFLMKCTVFLIVLSLLSRMAQSFMGKSVLPLTSIDDSDFEKVRHSLEQNCSLERRSARHTSARGSVHGVG